MKNFVRNGVSLTIQAPRNTESGDLVLLGELCGVAIVSAAEGEEVTISTEGVFRLPKDDTELSAGERAYYRPDTRRLTKTATWTDESGNEQSCRPVGIFVRSETNASETAEVKLG